MRRKTYVLRCGRRWQGMHSKLEATNIRRKSNSMCWPCHAGWDYEAEENSKRVQERLAQRTAAKIAGEEKREH